MSSKEWSVGVITAPRPGLPTIGVTLASLAAAGWPIDTIRIFDDHERAGCYQGWLRALAALAASPPDHWLLLTEDDAQFSAGLRNYLDGQLDPLAWNSLFCAGGLHSEVDAGWREVATPRQCWGSVAYCLTVPMARRFLEMRPHFARRDGTDYAVGCFCRTRAIAYRIHSPSFVRHTGIVTSLDESGGTAENRQCQKWIAAIDREGAHEISPINPEGRFDLADGMAVWAD